jgi:hypothetical protein
MLSVWENHILKKPNDALFLSKPQPQTLDVLELSCSKTESFFSLSKTYIADKN